jgi:hypothetical protein
LGRRRIRVEFQDGDGARYTVSLDGRLSRDKVLRVMDLVDLLSPPDEAPSPAASDTTFGRLCHLIEKAFPLGAFSSTDLLEAFEDEYQLPIRLSTLATYLARLTERGFLRRERTPSGWLYRRRHPSPPVVEATGQVEPDSRPIR